MPQGEAFWNPYRLIPDTGNIHRVAPVTDERFRGRCGKLHCSLTNLTLLFIGGNRDNKSLIMKRNNRAVVPGTSLKGLLRSIIEIVGEGCAATQRDGDKNACGDNRDLCIACRMFGMIEPRRNGSAHKGKIAISDALLINEKEETKMVDILMTNNGTRHSVFYRTPGTEQFDRKSRKLYFHQPGRSSSVPNIPNNLMDRKWQVNALLPGHRFDFTISFSNLTPEEYSLMLYSVCLEDEVRVRVGEQELPLNGPLRHKLGNGKPLGMGSCAFKISKIELSANPEVRYLSLAGGEKRVLENDALYSEIRNETRTIRACTSAVMQSFRKMMIWDENDPREFKYPDRDWFQNPVNSNIPLKQI